MSEGFTELSEELKDRGLALVVFETFIYFLFISLAIIGNSCVLLALFRNPQLRTIPNLFIASLAISDILLPLTSSPHSVAVTLLGRWSFNQDVCQSQGYFVIVLACSSLQILTLTAVNRFYRIVRPAQYRSVFTKPKTLIMIALCVGLACLEPLPYLLSGRRYVFHPGKMFCFQTREISVPNFIVYLYVGVPTLTLSICYFLVFKKMRIHQRTVLNNLAQGSQSSLVNIITHKDIKVTKILFITVIAFLVCWTPIVIVDFVDTFRGEDTFPRQVYFLYLLLGNMSGIINPFVYGVLNGNLRKEFKKMLCLGKRHRKIELNAQSHTSNSLQMRHQQAPN